MLQKGEREREGRARNAHSTLQIHLSQIESVRTAWMEGRSRARERNGWQTVFHGLSGQDTLSPGHTVSH